MSGIEVRETNASRLIALLIAIALYDSKLRATLKEVILFSA